MNIQISKHYRKSQLQMGHSTLNIYLYLQINMYDIGTHLNLGYLYCILWHSIWYTIIILGDEGWKPHSICLQTQVTSIDLKELANFLQRECPGWLSLPRGIPGDKKSFWPSIMDCLDVLYNISFVPVFYNKFILYNRKHRV